MRAWYESLSKVRSRAWWRGWASSASTELQHWSIRWGRPTLGGEGRGREGRGGEGKGGEGRGGEGRGGEGKGGEGRGGGRGGEMNCYMDFLIKTSATI